MLPHYFQKLGQWGLAPTLFQFFSTNIGYTGYMVTVSGKVNIYGEMLPWVT
jgi:hypothetical protein